MVYPNSRCLKTKNLRKTNSRIHSPRFFFFFRQIRKMIDILIGYFRPVGNEIQRISPNSPYPVVGQLLSLVDQIDIWQPYVAKAFADLSTSHVQRRSKRSEIGGGVPVSSYSILDPKSIYSYWGPGPHKVR